MEIIIMCGPSCSGKSTWIRNNRPEAQVVSADHFFMKNGEYHFDGSKIGSAHASCFKRFVELLHEGDHDSVVVDNTNTQNWERSPYVLAAATYAPSAEITFVVMRTPEKVLLGRNNGHGVPAGVKKAMVRRFEEPLPFWGQTLEVYPE